MINRMRLIRSLCGVLAWIGWSCTDNAVIDRNVPIPDHAWYYDHQPKLTVRITDTITRYNLYLNLRHTSDYKYANVYVLLHQTRPDGRDTTERIELRLAESDGRWLGRGGGSVYTHQQLIRESFRFPDTGEYTFTIEQYMRENPLRAVTDIGLRISPSN